ncbi:MAG: hypothetical protein OXU68_01280 [Bacteroidota bacterium]|nr:hypothetical protein [Bacteroidota bacterium]
MKSAAPPRVVAVSEYSISFPLLEQSGVACFYLTRRYKILPETSVRRTASVGLWDPTPIKLHAE